MRGKRFLSFLLAVLMLLSLMVTGVGAVDAQEETAAPEVAAEETAAPVELTAETTAEPIRDAGSANITTPVNDSFTNATQIDVNRQYTFTGGPIYQDVEGTQVLVSEQTEFYFVFQMPWGHFSLTSNNIDSAQFFTGSLDRLGDAYQGQEIGVYGGRYYLHIRAGSGTFTFTVNAAAASDWEMELNDSSSDATPIRANEPVYGCIMSDSDLDYYVVDIPAGGMTTLELTHPFEGTTSSGWSAELFGENLGRLGSYSFYGNTDGTESAASIGLAPGRYYIVLRPGSITTYSTYQLTVKVDPIPCEHEENDRIADATPMNLNEETAGVIYGSSDVDFYRLDVERPGRLVLNFAHDSFESADTCWTVTLYDDMASQMLYTTTVKGNEPLVLSPEIGLRSGIYYVKVEDASKQSSVMYRLTASFEASIAFEGENNLDPGTATLLPFNSMRKGSISINGDTDWYYFEHTENHGVMLTFSHPVKEISNNTWKVELLDSQYNVVASRTYKETAEGGVFLGGLGLAQGTYFVRVTGDGYSSATYTLSLTYDNNLWEAEPNDGKDSASQLPVNTPVKGQLKSSADKDYYVLTVDEPSVLTVDFRHPQVESDSWYWYLTLSDDDYDPLGYELYTGWGDGSTWQEIGLAPGTYYFDVEVSSSGNWSDGVYTLTANLRPADDWEQECNDELAKANGLALDAPTNGTLVWYGDSDWYKLTLPEDGGLYLDLSWDAVKDSSKYWIVELYTDANRNDPVDRWYFYQKNAPVENAVGLGLPAGDYYVYVKSNSSSDFTDAKYVLTAKLDTDTLWEREANNSWATANDLPNSWPDETVLKGSLMSVGDTDWYRIEAKNPLLFTLDFDHAASDSVNSFWVVSLLASDGTTVLSGRTYTGKTADETAWDGIGLGAGTYYLKVEQYGSSSPNDGVYTITADFYSDDYFEEEINDTYQTATPMGLGVMQVGSLMRSNDVDWHSFTLAEDTGLYLDFLYSQVENSANNWKVEILDSKRNTLLTRYFYEKNKADLNRSEGLGLPAGDYYVRVTGDGYSSAPYTLQLTRSKDAWEREENGAIATANALSPNGSVMGSLRTAGDQDYYAVTLTKPGAIRMDFTHPELDSTNTYWQVQLKDDQGNTLDHYNYTGRCADDPAARFYGLPAGTYYILVQVYSSSFYSTGIYNLKATVRYDSWEQEANNGWATANSLNLNQALQGNLTYSSDVDYYQLTVTKNGFLTLHFQHDTVANSSSCWRIELQDEERNTMSTFFSRGNTPGDLTAQGVGLAPGTYYVKVEDSSSHSNVEYILQAEFSSEGLWEREKNNVFGVANALPVNQTVYGGIMRSTDLDYYTFTLEQPGYVQLHFRHPEILDTNNKWQVTLYDFQRESLYSFYVSGVRTDVTEEAIGLPAGQYYVLVQPYGTNNDSSWSNYIYGLSVDYTRTDYWETERNNTVGAADPILTNTDYRGALMTSSDADYFTFDLPQADNVTISLQHPYVESQNTCWSVSILDEGGVSKGYLNSVGFKTEKLTSSVIALDAGTYTVRVQSSSWSNLVYTLRINTLGAAAAKITADPEDITGGYGETGSFTVGATGSGLTYQWQYSINGGQTWRNVGGNSASLTRTISNTNDGWLYRCKVTDSWGSTVTSETAKIILTKTALAITKQPQDVTVPEGGAATFTVTATGDDLLYQWQYSVDGSKWRGIANATESTLRLTAKAANDGYMYRCVVTDIYENTLPSNIATLTVGSPVEITGQPKSVTVTEGENAVFTVAAVGENLTYRWQYKTPTGAWKNCSSATKGYNTDTLTVVGAAYRSGYQYRCLVVSGDQSLTSDAATLTVKEQTTVFEITGQPESASVRTGESAVFTVSATGDGLTYQWQYRNPATGVWKNSSSATQGYNTDTLTVQATAARNGYQYRCVVSDGEQSLTSDAAALTVTAPSATLAITGQPEDATAIETGAVTFTVSATGANLTYQWQYMNSSGVWKNCSSATQGYNSDTLTVQGVSGSTNRNGYQYRCVVSDGTQSLTSEAAALTVFAIKTQPASVTVSADGSADFQVKATGADLSYQWQYKTPSGAWKNCSSATQGYNTAKLTVAGVSGKTNRNGYQYRCVITSGEHTLTTDAATLTVK